MALLFLDNRRHLYHQLGRQAGLAAHPNRLRLTPRLVAKVSFYLVLLIRRIPSPVAADDDAFHGFSVIHQSLLKYARDPQAKQEGMELAYKQPVVEV